MKRQTSNVVFFHDKYFPCFSTCKSVLHLANRYLWSCFRFVEKSQREDLKYCFSSLSILTNSALQVRIAKTATVVGIAREAACGNAEHNNRNDECAVVLKYIRHAMTAITTFISSVTHADLTARSGSINIILFNSDCKFCYKRDSVCNERNISPMTATSVFPLCC